MSVYSEEFADDGCPRDFPRWTNLLDLIRFRSHSRVHTAVVRSQSSFSLALVSMSGAIEHSVPSFEEPSGQLKVWIKQHLGPLDVCV